MRLLARLFTGPGMLLSGVNHVVNPKPYLAIMPRYLPAHRELVALSGVAEALSGAGALLPATRRQAGWLSVATLLAVFPANVDMALHPERYPKIPRWALWGRLPLQAWMVWAVWTTTQRRTG